MNIADFAANRLWTTQILTDFQYYEHLRTQNNPSSCVFPILEQTFQRQLSKFLKRSPEVGMRIEVLLLFKSGV